MSDEQPGRSGWKAWLDDYRVALDTSHSGAPLLGVFSMLMLSAALDLFGIGLIAPFIGMVMGQGVAGLPEFLHRPTEVVDISGLGLAIVVVFIAKAVVTYRMQRRIVRFSETHRAHLMARLLRSYLARDYADHLARPSAERVNTLFWHTAQYTGATLAGSLRLLTDLVVLLAVIALLLTIDARATLVLAVFLGIVVFSAGRWVRAELERTSHEVARGQAQALSVVQNSLGGFREIRILGAAATFQAALAESARGLADATARQNALHQVPRAVVETALVVFLVGISLVAAMRLMPIATSLLSGINNLRASRLALHEVAAELRAGDAPPTLAAPANPAPAQAFNALTVDAVSFTYPRATRAAVDAISLVIARGEVLGIAGRSGSGKSTLVDILLGLLLPVQGTIRADGQPVSLDNPAWQSRCAYIPQDVFLISGSLRDNIAFGAKFDEQRMRRVLQQCGLDKLVAQIDGGLDARLGERGAGLSGGQRQRVAIARALYREREILVMDEATSALDAKTESEVIETIRALRGQRTVIVVAHSATLLATCDRIVHLQQGRIAETSEGVVDA
jgi:ABC-type multidrug transport system fused ATPase/permease subunit